MRDVLLVEINLQQKRREEFGCVEFVLVFPEEVAAVDHDAVAQVEEIDGHERGLGVIAEDVGIVALGGGHFLSLVHFFDGGEEIAQAGGLFETHVVRGLLDLRTRSSAARVLCLPSRNSCTLRTAPGVGLGSGQAFHARPLAAMNVVLQAGLGMVAPEVDLAGRNQKMAVNEVDQRYARLPGK